MARATVTPKATLGHKSNAYGAGLADFTWQAADATNFEEFAYTGNELILAWNTDGANPYTVTIESIADADGRTGDISTYSLAAGDFAVFGSFRADGWRQSGSKMNIKASNAAVKWAVIRVAQSLNQ